MSNNIIELNNFEICCICLESTPPYIETICCHQKFHKNCFLQWIISKGIESTCPICREDIHSIDQFITVNDLYLELNNMRPLHNNYINNANNLISKFWQYPQIEISYHYSLGNISVQQRSKPCYTMFLMMFLISMISGVFIIVIFSIHKKSQ